MSSPTSPKTTNILLVENHPLVRIGLHTLIDNQARMQVVAEADDGPSAVEHAAICRPDIVLIDMATPDIGSTEAIAQILELLPACKIIAMCANGDQHMVEEAFQAGATGYVLKEAALDDLIQGIQAVQEGQVFLSPVVREAVVDHFVDLLADEHTTMAPLDPPVPVLITKFHRPQVPAQAILRPRLMKQFTGWQQRPFTLVSAPAGYGKSTAVCQWLEAEMCPTAWLSLDKEDDDLHGFLTYLVAAIRQLFPDSLQTSWRMLKAPTLPPIDALIRSLINDLDHCPERFVLALDDYHNITATAIHDLIGELLRHPPLPLHLMLITRMDPALNLLQLRAYQQMREIRGQTLSFTHEETAAFLAESMGTGIDEQIIDALMTKLEGWITGLRLVALSASDYQDLIDIVDVLPGEKQTVQYLLSEALSHQPEHLKAFMLKTSILDRFCPSLCEAVCVSLQADDSAKLDGRNFIEWLMAGNFFAISLDQNREWYRYHHLFQGLLRNQLEQTLDQEAIAALHRRASRWLTGRELMSEALQHAVAAGDITYAADVVMARCNDLMNREEWNRLGRWLNVLPDAVIDRTPRLLLAKAWLLDHEGKYPEAFALVDRIEELVADLPAGSAEADRVWGEIHTFRAYRHFTLLQGKTSLEHATRALDLLATDSLYARTFAIYFHTFSLQMIGDDARAVQTLQDVIDQNSPADVNFQTRLLIARCALQSMRGNLPAVQQSARTALLEADRFDLVESVGLTSYFLGCACYLRNEREEAKQALEIGLQNRYFLRPRYYAYCAFMLARIYIEEGKHEEASSLADDVVTYGIELDHPFVKNYGQMFQAELALMAGDIADAQQLVTIFSREPYSMLWASYFPALAFAKVQIAVNTPESLKLAAIELDHLLATGRSTHNINYQIHALALQSLLYIAQSDRSRAQEALIESLTLAHPGGYVRTFVDLGQPMASLLEQLLTTTADKELAAYLTNVLAAFSTSTGPQVPQPAATGVDALTARELELMRLFATELTTNEIADELVVTISTVRTHSKNIYSKLDAHSRFEAVSRARELGLI